MPKVTVLIVEDEIPIQKFLSALLHENGYKAEIAPSLAEAEKITRLHPPDALLLDLGLPDGDGKQLIASIRSWSQLPIIILSARGQEEEKVAALEAGADDYLTKPVGNAELIVRLRVALRHTQRASRITGKPLVFGDLQVDLERRKVTLKSEELHLTPVEYKLLTALVMDAGRVVLQGKLMQDVWGERNKDNTHYLRIYVKNLREKLGDDPLHPRYIMTEPGIGYRFAEE